MKRQASVQDVSWFIDLESSGKLDLNPPYQRRSVWSHRDRRFFLDTIFRNYPCPPIFIHKTIDKKGSTIYHVVDGKQRLESIILYSKNKFALDKEFGDENFNGKKFNKLDFDQKKLFWNYNVPVDFIEIPDNNDVKDIFDRVNRNSRNLEPQELRHARFDGWFITEAEDEAEDKFWAKLKLNTAARVKRMKDVQFISELLLIIIDDKIVGFDQGYLDEKYAELDSLDEEGLNFDLKYYLENKNRVKKFLSAMEKANKSVAPFAKTSNNLYTLWAYITLEKPTVSKTIAKKYVDFMTTVDKFTKSKNPDSLLEDTADEYTSHAYSYSVNSKGASTDLKQRTERLNILKKILS